ncbi:MAG: hypothetical protein AAB955_00255, partial [Patescibacteria group bacterium]
PGVPNFNTQGEKNLSPEQNMATQKEGTRSGGAGGRRQRDFNYGDAPYTPPAEDMPAFEEAARPREVQLELKPDANDKDMEHLLGILRTRGFKAVMEELDRVNNPHLEDDFHRLLIQYKSDGHPIPGLDKKDPLVQALDFVLLEVTVPELKPDEGGSLRDIVIKMEQLYQAIIPFVALPEPIFFKDYHRRNAIQKEHFTMELAVSHGAEEAIFYIAVPRKRRDIIEKQIFSAFPRALVAEKKDDYNIFNQFGVSLVAYGTYYRPSPLPIKMVEDFTQDPLNVMLTSFSRLAKEGEGAAIQISVAPAGEYYTKRFRKVLEDMQKGKKNSTDIFREHRYLIRQALERRAGPELFNAVRDAFKDEKKEGDKSQDSVQIDKVSKKLKSIVSGVNIRVAVSARTRDRAESMMADFDSAFGQFEDTQGNRFKFRRAKTKQEERELFRAFIFRTFSRGPLEGFLKRLYLQFFEKIHSPIMYYSPAMPMNLTELATLFHFAIAGGTSSREASTAGAKMTPAPPGLPQEGIIIGRNRYANIVTDVHFPALDRLRHLYVIGQTGVGKSWFLKNMIIQDIENGEGVCFIDPHGPDVQDILSRIPKERYDDVIYFDPAYTERPMGLNMLEYDPRFPEQKTFVVDEMFKIFQKLYGQVPEAFGPIFEQYFRNAAMLVVEDPETGSTLMDISRVLADEDFRKLKLSRCRNPVVAHFWEDVATQVRGEGSLANIVPYITSKFDIFIANEIMRPIVGQQRSSFNFEDIMNNKKIFLVNLSKGRLGDVNANLIGLILVGKIMMTALGRDLTSNPPPFYLYIDEFQNVTTDTIATILSEARKFKLSLTMAHQYVLQLIPKIREAVFGNVGSMAVFRIGPDDAEVLSRQLYGTFTQSDLLKVKNFHAYLKLLADNKPTPPFTIETFPFASGDPVTLEALKQMSYQRFGRQREAVEAEIREKYNALRGS